MQETLFVVAVAVVVTHRGRVLALRRAATKDAGAGIWETVSGRLEDGESLEACALREVREESGLSLERLRGPILLECTSGSCRSAAGASPAKRRYVPDVPTQRSMRTSCAVATRP